MSVFTGTPATTETLATAGGGDGLTAMLNALDSALTSGANPGHTHTLANGASDVTATAAELNALDGYTGNVNDLNILSGADTAGVTSTELQYLNGVTSAIQTQIDTKAPTASPTFTGTVTLPTGLTGVLRADSGVVSTDSDVTDLVTAADLTTAGKVELATIAETDTGTDATRAVTPDGLQGSKRNIRYLQFRLLDKDTDVSADTTVGGDFIIPFTGTILQDDTLKNQLFAWTDIAGVTGTMVVDVHLNGTTIMTTNKLDIETGEQGTQTATTQPDLTTTSVTAGDVVTFDIDAAHSGTAAKGLVVGMAIRED